MKLNRYIYAATFIVTVAFVVWLAIGVTQALGWTAWATVVGSGVAVMLLLWIVAAELAFRAALRGAHAVMVRIVREELHRDDVDALADSLTADVLAEQTAEEFVAGVLADQRPGRHTLMETTQELFTHEQLFGDGTLAYHDMAAYNDVTEAFPGRLFPDGE